MEQIRDNTMVGKALWDEGCFTSQDDSVQKTSTPRAASSGTPGQPQNGFKARGPLSGVCIDLKSTPNKKEFLSGGKTVRMSDQLKLILEFNNNMYQVELMLFYLVLLKVMVIAHAHLHQIQMQMLSY